MAKQQANRTPYYSQDSDTKNRILDVAERLFAQKGFDATGIDQIAREVGITKSVIYHHFKNKEALISGIFERARQYFFDAKREKSAAIFRDKRSIQSQIEQVLQDPEMYDRFKPIFRIMLMETMKSGERRPLFDLWDENTEFVFRNWSEFMRPEVRDDPERFQTETFFLFMMPIVGLLVFEDSWAERYGTTADHVRMTIRKAFAEMYEEYIMPHLWGDGIHRLRERYQSGEDSGTTERGQ